MSKEFSNWVDVNGHRYDALIDSDLTDSEFFVDQAIRRGLGKNV